MNPHNHDDLKHWRQDCKDWMAEAMNWQDEKARALASLRELEGFLGAHGDQLDGLVTRLAALEATVENDSQHDVARNIHHESKALHTAIKGVHHDLMARTNALREMTPT